MGRVIMMGLRHILRLFAAALLLVQLGLPYAQAQAVAGGADLASLVCNPSGKSVSSEAKAALGAFLDAVGDDEKIETPPDCDRCVTPHVSLPTLAGTLSDRRRFSRSAHARPVSETLSPITARGPPCGKRAPPLFV